MFDLCYIAEATAIADETKEVLLVSPRGSMILLVFSHHVLLCSSFYYKKFGKAVWIGINL